MIDTRKVLFLTSFLLIILLALLDRGEPWVVTLVKLAVDVRLVLREVLFSLLLESLIENINFLAVRVPTSLSQVIECLDIWLILGQGVFRVGTTNGQKVVLVQDDASLLHDTERSLST